MYYIGSMQCNPNYLEHSGKKGMHWGQRLYQNKDGSLTPLGRIHYGYGPRKYVDPNTGKMSEEGRRKYGDWQETAGHDVVQRGYIRDMNKAQRKIARNINRRRNVIPDKDRIIPADGTAKEEKTFLTRRIQKQKWKYDDAKHELAKYNNMSESEKRKERISEWGRKTAAVVLPVAASAAVAAYVTNPQVKSYVDSLIKGQRKIPGRKRNIVGTGSVGSIHGPGLGFNIGR